MCIVDCNKIANVNVLHNLCDMKLWIHVWAIITEYAYQKILYPKHYIASNKGTHTMGLLTTLSKPQIR